MTSLKAPPPPSTPQPAHTGACQALGASEGCPGCAWEAHEAQALAEYLDANYEDA